MVRFVLHYKLKKASIVKLMVLDRHVAMLAECTDSTFTAAARIVLGAGLYPIEFIAFLYSCKHGISD